MGPWGEVGGRGPTGPGLPFSLGGCWWSAGCPAGLSCCFNSPAAGRPHVNRACGVPVVPPSPLHPPRCFNWGTLGWVLRNKVDYSRYRHFVWLDSSVRCVCVGVCEGRWGRREGRARTPMLAAGELMGRLKCQVAGDWPVG